MNGNCENNKVNRKRRNSKGMHRMMAFSSDTKETRESEEIEDNKKLSGDFVYLQCYKYKKAEEMAKKFKFAAYGVEIWLRCVSFQKMVLYEKIKLMVHKFFSDMKIHNKLEKARSNIYDYLRFTQDHFSNDLYVYPAHTLEEYLQDITSNPSMPQKERMKYDMIRTSTFSNFPRNCPVSTIGLVKVGFYYEGQRDEVVCFKCGKKYSNWQAGDDPLSIHKQISPTCSFIKEFEQDTQNWLPSNNPDSNQSSVLYSRDSPGRDRNGDSSSILPNERDSPNRNQNLASSNDATCSHGDIPLSTPSSGYSRFGNERNSTCTSSRQNVFSDETSHNISVSTSEVRNSSVSNLANYTQNSDNQTSHSCSHKLCTVNAMTNDFSHNINISTSEARSSSISTIPSASNVPRHSSHSASSQLANPQNLQNAFQNQGLRPQNQDIHVASQNQEISSQNQDTTSQNHGISAQSQATASASTGPKSAAATLEPLGISIERPKYPQYAVLTTRIASYKDWPTSLEQRPEELARAGFLYEGTNDFTRCFFCAGGLRDWEPGDIPWIEHARWYEKCVFLRQCMGDEFVKQVKDGNIEDAKRKLNGHRSGASKDETKSSSNDRGFSDLGAQHGASTDENPRKVLMEENRHLREQQICQICKDEDVSVVFLPCGHMVTCVNCAPAIRTCPLCKRFIKGTIKAILS